MKAEVFVLRTEERADGIKRLLKRFGLEEFREKRSPLRPITTAMTSFQPPPEPF